MPNKMVNKGQTTTTAQPWDQSQPYILGAMNQASDLQQSGQGFNPYPGQMVADMSSQTQGALSGIQNLAQQPDQLLQSAGQGLQQYASGANVNGGSPQFNQALNYQSGQLTDDINRGFSLGGRYGSGAHVGMLGDTVGQFRNQALQGEMARQQGLQMQAIGMAPGMSQAQYQPMMNLLGAGQMFDQHNQAGIDAEMARFQTGDMANWNRLNAANQIYGPYGQMFGTQTSTEMGPRGFPVLRALGGIASTALGML